MSEKPYALRSVPGFHSNHAGIQLAAQCSDQATDEDLQFIQQLGIEWMMVGISDQENQNADYYKHLKSRFAEYDLQIYRISNSSVHNMPEVTLNLPKRDEKVEEFARLTDGSEVEETVDHGGDYLRLLKKTA